MAKVTVRLGDDVLETCVVKDGATIGRSPQCDIVIDNLGVSRQHAEIVRTDEVFVVKDLESGNGVYVNKEKVTEKEIQDGDVIQIGKFSLTFEHDPFAAMGLAEMTMVGSPAEMAQKQEEQSAMRRKAPAPHVRQEASAERVRDLEAQLKKQTMVLYGLFGMVILLSVMLILVLLGGNPGG